MSLPDTRTNDIRIASIDVLRALTMLGMIFVNDLWSLRDIPAWLEHVSAETDGMGLADIVFPAFLFIVGMSVPFAVRNRQAKGDSKTRISWHILRRGFALLLMGLFLVNGEYINQAASGMTRGAWNVLACSAFILLWNQYPSRWSPWVKRGLQAIGLMVLGWLVYRYRGGENGSTIGFSTWWWGILGLIGWAYLLCALLYNWTSGKIIALFAGWVISMLFCSANHLGWLPDTSILRSVISPFGEGAMTAFTIGGALASQVFWSLHHKPGKRSALWLYFTAAAAFLLLPGFGTRPAWGISKIRATPSWVMICSSIMLVTFLLVHWLVDLKQKSEWFRSVRPAGTETLLCYLIPYYVYAVVQATGWSLPAEMLTGGTGLLKSFLFALLVIFYTGWLSKKLVRLKL